jgi:hypothetical protein
MDESGQAALLLSLFLDLLLSGSKAVISAAIAILVRHRAVSVGLALMIGALEGLLGSRLELLDIYLSRSGWEAIDALALTTAVLSALASVAWWTLARIAYALVRRAVR